MASFKSLLGFACVLTSCFIGSSISGSAQSSCTLLKVVGSGLNVANKALSAPSLLVTKNNWNTDFVVPPGVAYRRYVATVKTDREGQYDLKLALKYSDGTSKVFFEQPGRPMGIKDTFTMTAQSGAKKPYQVNVLTGGDTVAGKTVTTQVSGCK